MRSSTRQPDPSGSSVAGMVESSRQPVSRTSLRSDVGEVRTTSAGNRTR